MPCLLVADTPENAALVEKVPPEILKKFDVADQIIAATSN